MHTAAYYTGALYCYCCCRCCCDIISALQPFCFFFPLLSLTFTHTLRYSAFLNPLTYTSACSYFTFFEYSCRHFTLPHLVAVHRYTLIYTNSFSSYLHTHTHTYLLTSIVRRIRITLSGSKAKHQHNPNPHTLTSAHNAPLTHLKKHVHTHTHLPLLPSNYVTMLIPRQRIKIALRLWMPVLMLRIVVAHTLVMYERRSH